MKAGQRLLNTYLLSLGLGFFMNGREAIAETLDLAEIEANADESRFVLSFGGPLSPDIKVNCGATEAYIQCAFPGTELLGEAKFIEGQGPYISKLALFELEKDTAALRIFLKKDPNQIIRALKTEVFEDHFIGKFNHKDLEAYGLSEHIAPPPVPSEAKAELSHLEANQNQGFYQGLEQKLITVTVASLCLLALVFFWQVFLRRKGLGKSQGLEQRAMKVLDTMYLAPKKKLTLMEIQGEKILLGVSEDGIQYLTTIKAQSPVTYKEAPRVLHESPAIKIPLKPKELNKSVVRPKTPPAQKAPQVISAPPPSKPRSSFEIAISDEGVKTTKTSKSEAPRAIEDVTQMIRAKLKNIP